MVKRVARNLFAAQELKVEGYTTILMVCEDRRFTLHDPCHRCSIRPMKALSRGVPNRSAQELCRSARIAQVPGAPLLHSDCMLESAIRVNVIDSIRLST